MELKYLSTFRTILEEGSFTAAAEKLNYTQSTITFQIGQLENELSVRLFEKIGRKMTLIAAGRELVPYVNEVLGAVDKLSYFDKKVEDCGGTLRIGAAETYLSYKLPTALKRFVSWVPKARLYIRSMNCYEIRNALVSGELDVGIFYKEVGGYEDSLLARELGSFPVCLVASPETARKFSDFTTPKCRLQVPLIINEPNCVFRQIFERYLHEQEIILDHTIEMGSIETIKRLVEHDVGVSFLPRYTVEEELRDGRLQEIKTNIREDRISIVCAIHKNKWVSPLIKLFLQETEKIAEASLLG